MSEFSLEGTTLRKVAVAGLTPAPWNPKPASDDGLLKKLIASIVEDGSAGVLAVRLAEDGRVEVIDGNHRLEAIRQMGLEEVTVEDFGQIPLAKAVLIAHRRNHQWVDEVETQFAELLRDVVLPEMTTEEIERFMPESASDLDDLLALLDWEPPEGGDPEEGDGGLQGRKVVVTVGEDTWAVWQEWLKRVEAVAADDTPEEAFRLLMEWIEPEIAEWPGTD